LTTLPQLKTAAQLNNCTGVFTNQQKAFVLDELSSGYAHQKNFQMRLPGGSLLRLKFMQIFN